MNDLAHDGNAKNGGKSPHGVAVAAWAGMAPMAVIAMDAAAMVAIKRRYMCLILFEGADGCRLLMGSTWGQGAQTGNIRGMLLDNSCANPLWILNISAQRRRDIA
ncbi:hypothetical protein ACFQFQ_19895 [Sulfitobacter porphyrae]|uniref:Uncharacterized protein n=1 Tax=Sulfitobacter porphyrae TaxID=1246864 RepID=A0ABW2B8S2_9RHOB